MEEAIKGRAVKVHLLQRTDPFALFSSILFAPFSKTRGASLLFFLPSPFPALSFFQGGEGIVGRETLVSGHDGSSVASFRSRCSSPRCKLAFSLCSHLEKGGSSLAHLHESGSGGKGLSAFRVTHEEYANEDEKIKDSAGDNAE